MAQGAEHVLRKLEM